MDGNLERKWQLHFTQSPFGLSLPTSVQASCFPHHAPVLALSPTALIYFLQYQGKWILFISIEGHIGQNIGDLCLVVISNGTWVYVEWRIEPGPPAHEAWPASDAFSWALPLLLWTHPPCLIPTAPQDSRWQEEYRGKTSGLWHL